MCQLSWNLGASTSWKTQGKFRPVIGLLYLLLLKKRVGRLKEIRIASLPLCAVYPFLEYLLLLNVHRKMRRKKQRNWNWNLIEKKQERNLEVEQISLPTLPHDSLSFLRVITHLLLKQTGKTSAFAHKSLRLAELVPASNKLQVGMRRGRRKRTNCPPFQSFLACVGV